MPVKIFAKKMTGYDLKPGDLFSTVGPEYWDTAMDKGSAGERVFIRTNVSPDEFPDADQTVYLVKILPDNGDTDD